MKESRKQPAYCGECAATAGLTRVSAMPKHAARAAPSLSPARASVNANRAKKQSESSQQIVS